MRLFVEAQDLIGDTLMLTPALRAYAEAHPGARVVVVTDPDTVAHRALLHNPHVSTFWDRGRALGLRRPEDAWVETSAGRAYQQGVLRRRPLVDGFADQFGVALQDRRLDLRLTDEERSEGRRLLEGFGPAHRVVVCARHSATCIATLRPGAAPNKCFPNAVWTEVADWLIGLGYVPLAVGAAAEEGDPRYADWPGPRLYGAPLRAVMGLVAAARAAFCVDTGLRHVAAALGTNLACVSGAIPLWLIASEPTQEGQVVAERHIPVPEVTFEACKALVWEMI